VEITQDMRKTYRRSVLISKPSQKVPFTRGQDAELGYKMINPSTYIVDLYLAQVIIHIHAQYNSKSHFESIVFTHFFDHSFGASPASAIRPGPDFHHSDVICGVGVGVGVGKISNQGPGLGAAMPALRCVTLASRDMRRGRFHSPRMRFTELSLRFYDLLDLLRCWNANWCQDPTPPHHTSPANKPRMRWRRERGTWGKHGTRQGWKNWALRGDLCSLYVSRGG